MLDSLDDRAYLEPSDNEPEKALKYYFAVNGFMQEMIITH